MQACIVSPISMTMIISSTESKKKKLFFFFLMIRRPPRSPLFPNTPLFRSLVNVRKRREGRYGTDASIRVDSKTDHFRIHAYAGVGSIAPFQTRGFANGSFSSGVVHPRRNEIGRAHV